MSHEYTQDWTTPHQENFDLAFSLLPPKGYAVEIGTFEGRTTRMLSARFGHTVTYDIYRQRAAYNLDNLRNVEIVINKLVNRVERLPEYINFAYIDGSHISKDVNLDLAIIWTRLEVGGIVLLDDYGWEWDNYIQMLYTGELTELIPEKEKRIRYFSPKAAIDSFIENNPEVEVVMKDYQIMLRKKFNLDHIRTEHGFFLPPTE